MTDQNDNIVAVVDDDEGHRDSLKFLLETFEHRVVAYASAAAFLADRAIRPVCLILDYYMPAMTGLELALHLRREADPIPILLMTGTPSATIASVAAQAGIDRVMRKPLDPDALLHFVRTAIASRG